MENKDSCIFRVTYKIYIDGKKYKKEANVVATDFIEAAERVEKILNENGEDYTIHSVKFINFFEN